MAGSQPLDVTAALRAHNEKLASIEVTKDTVTCDLGHLMAADSAPTDLKALKNKKQREEYIRDVSRDNTQILFNAIWQLPSKIEEDAVLVELPAPVMRLPREKPVPEEKAETKWEKFAKLKGITKTKRSRMVWDEEKGDWAPRWGYKRAGDDTKAWALPVPDNADPYEDQFEKAAEAKKSRIAKNEKNRQRNLAVAAGQSGKNKGQLDAKKDLEKAIMSTKKSTASIGKFDPVLANEPQIKTPGVGKKRKFAPNVAPKAERGDERAKLARLADKVVNQSGKVMDTTKAANRALMSVQQKAKAAKQGKKKRGRK